MLLAQVANMRYCSKYDIPHKLYYSIHAVGSDSRYHIKCHVTMKYNNGTWFLSLLMNHSDSCEEVRMRSVIITNIQICIIRTYLCDIS